jgi:hypothetical protein
MKATKILAAAALFTFATAGSALAFHSGGVAECEGCHTMHNTKGSATGKNVPLAKGTGLGASFLLQGTDQSSTCMNCHNVADTAPNGYHIASDYGNAYADGVAPVQMTPGGDFGWLKKTYTYSVRGTATTDDGHGHGHDINAADYGYGAGANNAAAPGGTYPQANLACSSCHDPHGKYRRLSDGTFATTGVPTFGSGSYNNSKTPVAGVYAVGAYRILGGKGYLPKSLSGSPGLAFGATTNPPDAVAPSTYNRSEATGQTHVAYGQGMSEWCANCHAAMLENAGYVSGAANHVHPAGAAAGKLTAAIVANYNSYVSSGIMTNADMTKAYSTLAPFELGTNDYTVLQPLAVNTDTKDQSATTNANVMCLSCHRAHASGFPDMARFNLENEFMTVADGSNVALYDSSTTEGKINLGKTVAEQTAAYYGRPATAFGPYARDYCNKCHAKD